jgi:hypothetical protein
MAQTHVVTIQQEVHVPHNETVVRTWYDRLVRTITREIDADGQVVSEQVEEQIDEMHCELEEETLETDTDLEEAEVVSEEIMEEE